MKTVIIREVQGIVCPATGKTRLLKDCDECDAFGGYRTLPGKDGKIPVAVRCKVDKY